MITERQESSAAHCEMASFGDLRVWDFLFTNDMCDKDATL